MHPQTLRFKVGLYLTIALTVAMFAFSALVVWHQRQELLANVAERVTQLSEVITKSTRYAMLQNQPDYVERIIHDVGNQESIDKVRILSKDGKITHSTNPSEIGQTLDRKTEACSHCHQSEQPLEQVPRNERTWTFTTPEGRRMLGSMEVIRNEPSCYAAACHQHSKATSVLGVLDIVYSLDEIERAMRINAITIGIFSLGFIIVASLAVSFFVHRLVQVPLNDLENGARKLASGDLEQTIPVRSADEFGQLAASFNAMTAALKNSRQELQEWGRTLEAKVEKRTQELRIAQAEAVRGEKLASVGLLAAGIAHELNNPEDTARIVERPAHLRDIEVTMDLDRGLPPVWVDADLIKQVVMNMLVNAQHAIEEKGSITIRSRRCPDARRPEPGAEPVPMVEISIVDTGCGIPEKNLSRIFDPFFTSKGVGKGTGLGLSVSHGIVRAHGGTIEVESEVGEGSTFRVYLPIKPLSGDAMGSGSGQ